MRGLILLAGLASVRGGSQAADETMAEQAYTNLQNVHDNVDPAAEAGENTVRDVYYAGGVVPTPPPPTTPPHKSDRRRRKAKAPCGLEGMRAVDDLMDAAVYIMASLERCDKNNGPAADDIRCALDVSSAIQSVNAMINVILKTIKGCGNLHHTSCGRAVGVLTEGLAGLSAAASGIVAKCPNALNHGVPLDTVGQAMANAGAGTGAMNNNMHGNQFAALPGNANFKNLQGGASFGQCLVNVKGTMKSLFKAIKRILTLKDCDDPTSEDCVHNDLKVMAALVGMGEYLAGAIGKCTPMNAGGALETKRSAICAQYSLKLIHQLGVTDRAAVAMADKCDLTSDQRLYLDGDTVKMPSASASSVNLALAALLPISAVLAFVAGSRFAKKPQFQPARDFESLVPCEE